MHARSMTRLGRIAAVAAAGCLASAPALAGGGHGGAIFHGGGSFHGGGGFHGAAGGVHGFAGGGARFAGRGLPPVSGVIHERPGMRPYMSGYGHTNTAVRFGGGGRQEFGSYGHTGTGLGFAGYGRAGFGGGYGHTATALRAPNGFARPGFARRGDFGRGLAFRDRLRFVGGGYGGGYGGGFGGGYGGTGYADLAGYGGYGGGGTYGGGGGGTYGGGGGGTYGGGGAYADAGAGGYDYASETPLAARFAEPPLGPSPGAPYSPADRYAYAASEDVGAGPRIITVNRGGGSGCTCARRGQAEPVVYRYGVGTAY